MKKKRFQPTFCVFLASLESKFMARFLSFFSLFFLLLFLLDFTFSSSKFSSLSHSLFLLLSRFGGGGGGRFCPLWFEPSVVFSSLSSIRRLENE